MALIHHINKFILKEDLREEVYKGLFSISTVLLFS